MKTSNEGLAELAGHEGIVSRRYLDSVGVWTVGIGHTKAAGAPDPVTVTTDMSTADLLELFRQDVAKYEKAVNAVVKVAITQTEFDALVSFHYNTGSIGKASLVKSLNAGDRPTAATQFLNWNKPPEIISRRTKEMLLFRDGTYANDGKANLYPATDKGQVQWSKGKSVDVLALIGGGSSTVPALTSETPLLRRGSKGPGVARWQEAIGLTGDDVDGDFGPGTEAATINWQKSKGLVGDGVVGPRTWATIA